MDFGGHDSAFTDNIIYVGGDGLDGQNCFNAGGMLAGHGTVWARNKCVLQHSKVVGEVSTCDCPGGASTNNPPGAGKETEAFMGTEGAEGTVGTEGGGGVGGPPSVCGLTLGGNEYYGETHGPLGKLNASVACGNNPKGLQFDAWVGAGNDHGSKIYEMPDDDTLIYWARELLDMPVAPGPSPPSPPPLPPAPTPHFPNTCEGHCGKSGFCCVGATSGCQQPSCAQGCIVAALVASEAACVKACTAMVGQCSYTVNGTTLNECGSCPDGCGSCEGEKQCESGCKYHFGMFRAAL